MSRLQRLAAAVCVGVFALQGVSFAEVLPMDARNLQLVKRFRNVSGATTTSGTAFILQDENSDANVLIGNGFGQESSLGMDVTTTTTADSGQFMGCQLDDTCLNNALCNIVTWGPAICLWAGSTDNTNTRMAQVGTTIVAGQLGSGVSAGLTMSRTLNQTNDTDQVGSQNGELRWIWVQPDNN